MNVSHEIPLDLLEESRVFNDYDYALVHVCQENQEYFDFYKESLRQGREVILDNSLFETETMFDADEFAKYVTELGSINPEKFYYIVPDALEEKQTTINSFKDWNQKYKDLPGNKIGVVQGKTLEELVECYIFMTSVADKVAISFDYSYYETQNPNAKNKYEAWMLGRQQFITYLYENDLLDYRDIHLLGCGLANEFKYYTENEGFECIKTVDTSNPIVMGLKGHRYHPKTGLDFKESVKLVDLFDTIPTKEQIDNIYHNLKIFRSFVGN